MIFSLGTTDLSWGSLMLAGNREPLESRLTNLSYTDFLWELNQVKGAPSDASYTKGANGGGFGNYYVGLITSVPYVRDGKKAATKGSHNQGADNESIAMKGPWYVSYCGLDTMYKTTGNGKYGFHPDGDGNTYYADRIVLKQEMDYALDKNYVNKYQLGTYYTGVGLWWDSWNTINGGARNYRDLKEVPDGTYFTSTSYSEIFNDYAYNRATGNYAHAEGYHTYVVNAQAGHAEGYQTIVTGTYAHAEGYHTRANATSAHAEGQSTTATGTQSHAEGQSTTATGAQSHAEGLNTLSKGNASHSEGTNSLAYGDISHVEGYFNVSYQHRSHVEGYSNIAVNSTYVESHIEGSGNRSHANRAHIEGISNLAYGDNSHIEGTFNVVYATYSSASGISNRIEKAGNSSLVTGYDNVIENSYEVALGQTNHSYTASTHNGTVFTIGDGKINADSTKSRHNIVGVFKDGTVEIEGTNTYIHNTTYTQLNTNVCYVHASDMKENVGHLHTHVSNEACVKAGTGAYFKGGQTTYIGKDQEGAKTTYSVVTSTTGLEIDADGHYHVDVAETAKEDFHKSLVTNVGTTETHTTSGVRTTTIKGLEIQNYEASLDTNITGTETHDTSLTRTTTIGGLETQNYKASLDTNITGTETHDTSLARTTTIGGLETQNYNKELASYVTGGSYLYYSEEVGSYIKGSHNERIDSDDTLKIGGNKLLNVTGKSQSYITTYNYTEVGFDNVLRTVEGNNISYIGKDGARLDNLSYFRSTYLIGDRFVLGAAGQTVNGSQSLGFGKGNKVSGESNAAFGINNEIGIYTVGSFEFGKELRTYTQHNVVTGTYNKSYTNSYIEIGIGTSEENRKNALTISQYGVSYFHLPPYTYDSYINSVTIGKGKIYDPDEYPDESKVVSLSYYNLSYKGLYDTVAKTVQKINNTDAVQTLDSISRSYTTNTLNYTSGHYDQESEGNVTAKHTIVQNSATKELAGLMSGEDKVRSDDIEDRLNASVKSANLPTFSLNTITWKVYNNNKSKVLATYTTEANSTTKYTSITAEYGTYVTAENYTIKMNLASNYDAAFLASVTTKGSFTMPSLSSFSPIEGGSAVMTGSLSLASTYISPYDGNATSKNVAPIPQTVSAIQQFGLQYLTTRTLANGHTQVYRINDPDTYKYDQNSFNVKVSGTFGIIKWYGITSTNPATISASMTQEDFEKLFTGTHASNSSNTKGLSEYPAKTDTVNKYFMYVYRAALGKLSKAEVPGADATAWFNTKNPKTITITRTTTGMKEDYYLVYSLNENALNGALLTFS